MGKNQNLHNAKSDKNDEFYTRYEDIEKELENYKKHFEGKIVYCNCDNPEWSNFWKFFYDNFDEYKLKKLICTHYSVDGNAYALTYDGVKETKEYLSKANGESGFGDTMFDFFSDNETTPNGEFASAECIEYLKEADIVVTNPPFSLFREFVALMIEYGKDFLIVGNMNALTYKELFPYIKQNKMWTGEHNGEMAFRVPPDSEPRETRFWIDADGQKWRSLGNAMWLTTLDYEGRHKCIELTEHYDADKYPTYSNYNAINVDKVCEIPCDHFGEMGVPVTFLFKYSPEQFEIIGHDHDLTGNLSDGIKDGQFNVNGVGKFKRILIRRITK